MIIALCVLVLVSVVVASAVSEINAASPGGGRGWSVARATTNFTSKMIEPSKRCWEMCASTTMVSLKFPLQDPLQAVATSSNNHTTIISNKLNCFITSRSL